MNRYFSAMAVVLCGLLIAAPAQSCSRILWNDNGRSVIVGRNMDWGQFITAEMFQFLRPE